MAQSAGGAEEYSQLRTEMTYRFQTLQILVGGTVAAFLSSASVAASALAYLLSVRPRQGGSGLGSKSPRRYASFFSHIIRGTAGEAFSTQ